MRSLHAKNEDAAPNGLRSKEAAGVSIKNEVRCTGKEGDGPWNDCRVCFVCSSEAWETAALERDELFDLMWVGE